MTEIEAVQKTLREAAALIRHGGWCTGAPARDAQGRQCYPNDPGAASWCAIGAIERACSGTDNGYSARYALRQVIASEDIEWWNDTHVKSGEVVATMMEQAAECAPRALKAT
jgi:hypothetical protein